MRDIAKATLTAVIVAIVLTCVGFVAHAEMPVSTNEAVCKISAGGSGTFIGITADKKLGLVISAAHVCDYKGQVVKCSFKNAPSIANLYYPGRVVRRDPKWDIAAVLIHNPGIPPVVIGDLQRHDGLYSACGYGGGRYSVARGRCYSFDNAQTWTRCGIYPGHSGGCLLDPFGAFCGVTNWNNGSNGPNPSGWSRSRSGAPLKKFIQEASYECGVFTRWRNRRGGHDICPPGGCPPDGGAAPGGGYAPLAPGYAPLTPLAGQQPIAAIPPQYQQQPGPQVLVSTPSAPPVAVDPYNPVAPVPDAVAVTPPPAAQPAANVASPWEVLSQQIEAEMEAGRKEDAARAAYEAYKAAMTGAQDRVAPPIVASDIARAPVDSDARAVVDRLPEVSVVVTYHDRTEEAKIDLASCFRNLIGAGGEAEGE